MSDCSRSAFKAPKWGDTVWRRLPNGNEVNTPADIELHTVELGISDGTERVKPVPLPEGLTIERVKVDGKRFVPARERDWDAESEVD